MINKLSTKISIILTIVYKLIIFYNILYNNNNGLITELLK